MSTNEENTNEPTDAERLRFLMQDGPEGFHGIPKDRYDLAIDVAMEREHDEPTEEDELDGFRRLIDLAILRSRDGFTTEPERTQPAEPSKTSIETLSRPDNVGFFEWLATVERAARERVAKQLRPHDWPRLVAPEGIPCSLDVACAGLRAAFEAVAQKGVDILPPVDTENQWLDMALNHRELPDFMRGQYDGMVTGQRHDRELVRAALAAKDEQIEAVNRRAKDFEEGFERVSPAYGALCVMLRNYGLPTEPKALAVELERLLVAARPPLFPCLFEEAWDLNDHAVAADLREACAAVRASRSIAAAWTAHAPPNSRLGAFVGALLRPFRTVELIRALCKRAGVSVSTDPNVRRSDLLVFSLPGCDDINWGSSIRSHAVSTVDAAAIVSALSELPPNAGIIYVMKVFHLFAS